jgi:hypothetical protein
LTDRVDLQNQPQHNAKKFDATTNSECKTNTAGWHDAEKDSKAPSMAHSTWQTSNFNSKPNFSAWCHILLFESILHRTQYGAELIFCGMQWSKK